MCLKSTCEFKVNVKLIILSMKNIFSYSIKTFISISVIIFLYSCGSDDNDNNENRLISDAILEWRGDKEIEGCGFFILMNDNVYKPVNEEIINNSFKSSNTYVVIEYELLNKKIETLCYDSHYSQLEHDGIRIISIKKRECTDCDKDDEQGKGEPVSIEDISFENYPSVDGSTSTRVLNQMIACKLLGVRYEWAHPSVGFGFYESQIKPDSEDIPEQYEDFFWKHIKTSQTHGAFMGLIDGVSDIILTSSSISPDEKAHAEAKGVKLIETTIALDAFVFVVNKENPVKTLTVDQIRKIYTGEISNWVEVGGNNAYIKVFTRPRNSGSEEVFRELVMSGLNPLDFPASMIGDMRGVFNELRDVDGICYTFMNYKEMIVRVPDNEVPKISINGIFPDESTIKNRTYPFITEVYVTIRSDLNHNTMAYKVYEWLHSEDVKPIIEDCGFVPK